MQPPASLSLRHAVALGLAHGPSELLPVSSSGHTILIPWLLRWPYGELDAELRKSFEVTLHAGTAAALMVAFACEVVEPRPQRSRGEPSRGPIAASLLGLDWRLARLILLSLLPAVLVGYTLEEPIQRRLDDPRAIAGGLLAGAAAMGLADARDPAGSRRLKEAGPVDGLLLGVAQALALIPGVSRSGATLATARARGFGRAQAQILSWQAGLPVILGASALKGWRLLRNGAAAGAGPALAAGGAAAFLSTCVSIRVARRRRASECSLLPYCLYRCALAAIVSRRLASAHNMTP